MMMATETIAIKMESRSQERQAGKTLSFGTEH